MNKKQHILKHKQLFFNSFITVGRFSGAADLLPLSLDFLLEA